MKTSGCNCKAMMSLTEKGESYAPYHENMALSWECPEHGCVSADFRPVNHTHPPAVVYRPSPTVNTPGKGRR